MSRDDCETEDGKHELEQASRDVLNDHLDKLLMRDCCEDACAICIGFRNLAHRLLDEGCTTCIVQNRWSLYGTFEAPGTISITRNQVQANTNGTRMELTVLAHEAGHWRSLKDGTRHPRMDEILDQRRTTGGNSPADAAILAAEEELAWKLGEALLSEVAPGLPKAFWEAFPETRTELLATYGA